ncbi:MAG: SagB/ThcOx family dehydrogenase [Gemmatimonadales bacterium]|jgi:SagB-type dehydrogenase family enzyme
MRQPIATILAGAAIATALIASPCCVVRAQEKPPTSIKLPEVRHQGVMSLEAALWARHSTRSLVRDSIALADLGQLLWAAQGVNRPDGHRTAPSAMAAYPLELYVLVSRVRDLPAGVYHYKPAGHEIETVAAGDKLPEFVTTAAHAPWIADAAAVVVFAGAFDRAAGRFRDRAERFIAIEVGAAAQNMYLQAAALGLGTTYAASAQDSAVTQIVGLPSGQRPMGIMPVGRPR